MKSEKLKGNVVRLFVGLVLVVAYLFLPRFGFPGGGLVGHLLYPLSHANVWHLLANVVCLFMIPCRLHLATCFALSVVCSFLPCFVSEETMGFSGVLFAVIGISWGKVQRFKDMLWRNKWILVVPMFIPHVNALIHLYCLVAGYFVGAVGLVGKVGGGGKNCHLSDWI